eukprot:gene28667-35566_t
MEGPVLKDIRVIMELGNTVNRPWGIHDGKCLFRRNRWKSSLHRVAMVVGGNSSFSYNIAGDGTGSFYGDGGLALSASMGDPVAITGDTSGNIYFADELNHEIRVVNSLAFAAVNSSGHAWTWGDAASGGDSSDVTHLLGGVSSVVQSAFAFAALKTSGGVVAWGEAAATRGSSVYRSSNNIVSLVGSSQAFAGVTGAGGVIAFGATCCGGDVDKNGYAQYLTSGV